MQNKRPISVFIASPGDLAEERQYFRETIRQLNLGFGDGAGVQFEALGWEDTLASTGRRSQGVINGEIDRCDVFILVLNRRWGQPAPDALPFSSYTEEEFHRALERWKGEGKPEIFVFFKRVDPQSEADPGPQLQKVMDFRRQLEETRQVLYHYFDDQKSFEFEVDRHLRAYARGELPDPGGERNTLVLPISALEEVEKAKELALQKTREAEEARDAERESRFKIEAMELEMAQDAARLSLEGKIEFARQKFARLAIESSSLQVLSLAFEFYYRTGDLDSAFSILNRWLSISGPDEKTSDTASAYGNLGNLYVVWGDLDRAEEMYKKALAIDEALDYKKGMANHYGNLGVLYMRRGDLDGAEEMYKKALAIDEALDRKEGMANQYGNLGSLYMRRGDLDGAEEMYKKALAIDEALDHKVGLAGHYGNLGVLYMRRGDLDGAEKMYKKALSINEALERKDGLANNYGNLGNLYLRRGDQDRAEEMYKKAFAIDEMLEHKEGLAIQSNNLGSLYQERGDIPRAKEFYRKALDLFVSLGSPEADRIRKLLDDLENDPGEPGSPEP